MFCSIDILWLVSEVLLLILKLLLFFKNDGLFCHVFDCVDLNWDSLDIGNAVWHASSRYLQILSRPLIVLTNYSFWNFSSDFTCSLWLNLSTTSLSSMFSFFISWALHFSFANSSCTRYLAYSILRSSGIKLISLLFFAATSLNTLSNSVFKLKFFCWRPVKWWLFDKFSRICRSNISLFAWNSSWFSSVLEMLLNCSVEDTAWRSLLSFYDNLLSPWSLAQTVGIFHRDLNFHLQESGFAPGRHLLLYCRP